MTIASGTNGTCTWTIADNGAMTIRPTSGSSGVLHHPVVACGYDWEWNEYIDKIKSVSFSGSVLIGGEKLFLEDGYSNNSYMYEMFKDAVNLESIDFTNARVSNLSSMYCAFMGCSKLASLDLSWITSVCSDGVDMNFAFFNCNLLTSVKFGSSLKIAKDDSTCFVPSNKQCKNNDTGLVVADEVSWFNLPSSERAGTWTRGVDSVFKVTAYRSTSTGTADEDGANASFDVVWATSTGTTRNLKIYSKLASESSYGTTPVINTNFTGNSGTNTVTVSDIGEAAHDYRVEFTDGTSTWIAFPSIASNVQLVTVDQDGNVVVLGSISIAGNTIADYIVESGTSGAWKYKKYADGTAECVATLSWNYNAGTSWAGGYYHDYSSGNVSFPSGLFNSAPKMISAAKNDAILGYVCGIRALTANSFTPVWYNGASSAGSITCVFKFEGTWK